MKHLEFVPKAVKTLGSEITLDNSEVLIDGVYSCCTSCHRYNDTDIINAMSNQLNDMPQFMFGGFTHKPADQ